MSVGADIWGYITGVLSVLAVITQLMRMNLPATKLKEFDELLRETEDLLHEANEEGLLKVGKFVDQTNETLDSLRTDAQSLRSQVYVAKTTSQQCLGIFTGLSMRISVLCSEVKDVKAEIATTSDKARETLRQLNLMHNQQEEQRIAPEMLDDEQVSDGSNGGGSSTSFNGSQSEGDEAENKTLNEVADNTSSDGQVKTLTYDGDTIHEANKIVEEACSVTAPCEAS